MTELPGKTKTYSLLVPHLANAFKMNSDIKKRRFRKRGGAKKKKKVEDEPTQNEGHLGHDYADKRHNEVPKKQDIQARVFRNPRPFEMSGIEATTLDRDLFSYLAKIQSDLNAMTENGQSFATGFQDDEDDDLSPSELLAQNALSELQSKMHEVAMDPSGSRVLESLLKVAKDEAVIASSLASVLSLGSGRVAVLAQHRCGSHVLEALISRVSSFPGSVPEVQDAMKGLVKVLSEWNLETLLEVMNSMSGSHTLRVVFAVLAGIPVEEPREAKLDDSEPQKLLSYVERSRKETPHEWHAGIQHCAQLLLACEDDKQLQQLPWQTATCTVLQSLVAALSCIDRALAKKLATTVLGTQLSDFVFDRCGSRFVERIITCLGAGIVWSEVKEHLTELINHPCGNFVAQRIFFGLKGRAQVKSVWDEIEDSIPRLLGFGSAREGVVLALLRATEVEGGDVLQRRAIKTVAKAIGTVGDKTKDLIGVLINGSAESWLHWRETIITCGVSGLGIRGKDSDLLQSPRELPRLTTVGMLSARCLLRYPGISGQNARDSMASLNQLEVLALCGDAVGSRLLEQWVALDSKNLTRFLNSLLSTQPNAVLGAARSPYGAQLLSRSVVCAPRNLQKQIMDILSAKITTLKSHRHGEIVVRKCRLEQYIHQEDEWFKHGSTRATRTRIFADILNDVHEESSSKNQPKSKKVTKDRD